MNTESTSQPDYEVTKPIGFIEGILGMSLYPWQDRALAPLEFASGPQARRTKISLVTPNGSGKSERIVAGAALYWLAVHERGKVVITTKDRRQLMNQIYPALLKHRPKFTGWTWATSPNIRIITATGGMLNAFTTDDAGRAEGWHKEDDIDGPLLIIADEAKSIPETIFQALDRCTYNALILTSSPGVMAGRFFDSHTKLRADYIAVKAGLVDCPHIPREKVEDIIRTYGENHPFTRSSLFGEFMDQDEASRFVVSLSALQKCLDNPPNLRRGIHAAFLDFAAGGDENVIAIRDGNEVRIAAAWREANKHASVGRFIREFIRAGLKPEEIWADASDKEMADLLAQAGWPINRQNFGAPAKQSEIYLSWGSEAWHETAASIERCEIILPDDEVLKAQLTSRMKDINSRGKLSLEDKHALRKRNVPSPDRADAVCGVLNVPDIARLTREPVQELWQDYHQSEEAVLAGADAGW